MHQIFLADLNDTMTPGLDLLPVTIKLLEASLIKTISYMCWNYFLNIRHTYQKVFPNFNLSICL